MVRFWNVAWVLCASVSAAVVQGGDLWDGYEPNTGPSLKALEKGKLDILWHNNPSKGDLPEEFMSTPTLTHRNTLLLGSSLNNLYLHDARTGRVLTSRHLRNSSFPCGDLRIGVGILGSPVVDKTLNAAFVYAKDNHGYHLHSVDLSTLRERPGFPVSIDGPGDAKGTHLNTTLLLQRPALTLLNGVVYGAFGGGCGDHSTVVSGWVVGVHARTGKVVSRWSTRGGSIWHAGAGLSSDRPSRLFLASADGDATSPYEGSIVRLDISRWGRLSAGDVFRPWNYTVMDGSQRDIGASTVALTGFVLRGRRTAVVGGKNGMVHVLDRERLGGYGVDVGANRVLQEWAMPEFKEATRARIFFGFGSWPGRKGKGGYLYVRPLDIDTVFVYSFDERRGFKQVATYTEKDTNLLGSGGPYITTDDRNNGVLWVLDLKKGLIAWNATPKRGTLTPLEVPKVSGKVDGAEAWTYKFQRPVFARGKVYVVAREGGLIAYGERR